jgi:glycosyltransferase involved in cell wall biosynthesis
VASRGLFGILADHLCCLLRRPAGYAAGLALTFRLARLDLRALMYHLFYFAEAVVVAQWLGRHRLNHVHVHFGNAGSTVALLARRIRGTPYSITVHGPDEFYGLAEYRLRQKIEGASFLCCISSFARSQLMKASDPRQWGKMEVCPLGVDVAKYTPRPAPAGAAVTILCTGTLDLRKGQTVLLAAAAQLRERGREIRIVLAGDGQHRRRVEAVAAQLRLQPVVTFEGAVNQDRVRELLQMADIFALPSLAEGVPVSLMEAMAMEIPCVSTYVAGIPELIESGVDGLLVPASDAGLLADAIDRLIADPGLRRRLGAAARRKIVERYNLSVNCERLLEIFAQRIGIPATGIKVAR